MENNKEIINSNGYTKREEIASSISHGIGAVLSIIGLIILIKLSLNKETIVLISSIIYGCSLIVLYSMSALYHAITSIRLKSIFKIFDHCSIFLLIAGTYTPLLLVGLNNKSGIVLCIIIWIIALISIVLNIISIEKFKKINIISCLLLGWIIVFVAKVFIQAVIIKCIILILLGGLAYSIGIVFYKKKGYEYMHFIWHLFVLLGSMLHYLAIAIYIL